jgi:glycosyltransferase involved in cell wall biosynthesis
MSKIGIDARFYRSSTAGIGRYTRGLLHQLSQIDRENEYHIFITPEDDKEYDIKAKNFHKVVVPITHYSVAEQTKFLLILNKYKFDLVHFLNFNHPIFYTKPFITTIHDLTMLLYPVGRSQKSWLRKYAFNKVMKNAAQKSSSVIAVSDRTREDIIKYIGGRKNKIKVIYEACDDMYHNRYPASKLLEFRKKYHLTDKFILFVSQWRPHKGLPELIKSFEILKSKYNISHKLVITGKPNKHFPSIIQTIKKSKYYQDICLPGFVPDSDLPLFYNSAEAFIFPSFYEGFGLGPLEAMACGTPVVSSNLSCMPEILGDAPVYFDPNKVANMAEKIYSVISNPHLRQKIKKKGLLRVKKYSWRKMAQETLLLYRNNIR